MLCHSLQRQICTSPHFFFGWLRVPLDFGRVQTLESAPNNHASASTIFGFHMPPSCRVDHGQQWFAHTYSPCALLGLQWLGRRMPMGYQEYAQYLQGRRAADGGETACSMFLKSFDIKRRRKPFLCFWPKLICTYLFEYRALQSQSTRYNTSFQISCV